MLSIGGEGGGTLAKMILTSWKSSAAENVTQYKTTELQAGHIQSRVWEAANESIYCTISACRPLIFLFSWQLYPQVVELPHRFGLQCPNSLPHWLITFPHASVHNMVCSSYTICAQLTCNVRDRHRYIIYTAGRPALGLECLQLLYT